MRPELVKHLHPRLGLGTSSLRRYVEESGQVIDGLLQAESGAWYPIVEGVPCFVQGPLRPDLSDFCRKYGLPSGTVANGSPAQSEQAKTTVTFSDKWRRFRDYGFQPSHRVFLQAWYCKKLGVPDVASLRAFFRPRRRLLEVGPGSGFNTRFMAENTGGTVFACDVSDAAYTTFANTRDLANCHVVRADLMDLPFPDRYFDFIIADGVLHHTPDTRQAVEALYRKLQPGGQFFFYLYKQMGAARRFCDEHIREHFTTLSPEECYAACEALTELGHELSKIGAKVTLTKPIDVLGIPAGTHDVHRLVYYNFVKCYWNDAFDYDTNNMVNFDWYHPHNAWQHTEAEVEGWLQELGASEYSFQAANPNGISALVRKAA
jgi:SAM-dependent methyltransferase